LTKNEYGKEIIDSESWATTEIQCARLHALQTLRQATCLLAQIQSVSHLLSRVSTAGTDSWSSEIELVKTPITHCQLPMHRPFGTRQLEIGNHWSI
jgi:hypothetical protein